MDDGTIVELYWDRNEEALAHTETVYGAYCRTIANNLLHDAEDAKECLDDALLAAWNSIPPKKPGCLRTYLGKLTREIAVDRLRKKLAEKRIPAEATLPFDELEAIVGENGVDEAVGVSELARLVSAFLREQKEIDRDLFIRRYWYYDSVEDLCRRYGFGRSRVLVKLKRTRDKLALYLKKEGYLV